MRSRCRCSMCPAIHINSRSWLRSSSTHEPSDPPLRVVILFHRSAHRGNSEHASTVGVRSVSAASFQSWISSLVTSEFEKSCASWGGRETDSLNRRKSRRPKPLRLLSSPESGEPLRDPGTPTTRMKRARVWDSGHDPAAITAGGEDPFFRKPRLFDFARLGLVLRRYREG